MFHRFVTQGMKTIAEEKTFCLSLFVGLPLSLIVKIWIFIAFSSTANGNTSSGRY